MRQHETGRKAAAPVEAVHAGGGPRAHQQTVVRRVQQAAQPHEQLPGQPSALIRRRGDQQAAFGDPSAAQGGALPFARAARRKGGRLVGKDRQADGFPPPDKETVQRPPRQPGVDVGGIIVRQTEQRQKTLPAQPNATQTDIRQEHTASFAVKKRTGGHFRQLFPFCQTARAVRRAPARDTAHRSAPGMIAATEQAARSLYTDRHGGRARGPFPQALPSPARLHPGKRERERERERETHTRGPDGSMPMMERP